MNWNWTQVFRCTTDAAFSSVFPLLMYNADTWARARPPPPHDRCSIRLLRHAERHAWRPCSGGDHAPDLHGHAPDWAHLRPGSWFYVLTKSNMQCLQLDYMNENRKWNVNMLILIAARRCSTPRTLSSTPVPGCPRTRRAGTSSPTHAAWSATRRAQPLQQGHVLARPSSSDLRPLRCPTSVLIIIEQSGHLHQRRRQIHVHACACMEAPYVPVAILPSLPASESQQQSAGSEWVVVLVSFEFLLCVCAFV